MANSYSAYWQAALEENPDRPSKVNATTKQMIKRYIPMLEQEVCNKSINALHYAFCINIDATMLMQPNDDELNHIICCALMVAAEECFYAHDSGWSYGARQLFDIKKAGINLPRPVIAAFLAQEGTWANNRSKKELLEGNMVAVSIYCARLRSLCRHLLNLTATCGKEEDVAPIFGGCEAMGTEKYDEIIAHFLLEYAVPYLESCGSKNAMQQVAAFQHYLKAGSDFYIAPSSTKYHLCKDGGLAEHTVNVLCELIRLTVPATKEELGACVLAAIGHDLCKIGVYKKQFKSKKVYISEGDQIPEAAFIKTDGGGSFYWADSFFYEFSDSMPFGHGRKSAYMLMGFFPEIGAEVYSAVDAHMGDVTATPKFMELYSENLLALNLHLADVISACITEIE